jgi:Fic family protein
MRFKKKFWHLPLDQKRIPAGARKEGVVDRFFTESPLWYEKVGRIHALLERVKISEEQHGDALRLRKLNRILSIHASTAIEGNRLTLGQVRDVINGAPVTGTPKDIREVQNAWVAYIDLESFDPWRVDSLLKAHALMTSGLVSESGAFRSVDVAVVRGDGAILHRGAAPADVPGLVGELLDWGEGSPVHPLIKSSAIHFMLEYIHPFRDGNGRIGRLWQTLILSKWDERFAWIPVETLVHYNQALYYKALQDSHSDKLDCRPFIDCMLDMIENSMYKFIDVASETKGGGMLVRETGTIAVYDPEKGRDPVADPENAPVGDFDPEDDPEKSRDPENEPEGDPESAPVGDFDPESDLVDDPDPENDPENDPESVPVGDFDPESDPVDDPDPANDPENDSVDARDPENDPESAPVSDFDPESDPVDDPDPENDPENDPESASINDRDPENDPEGDPVKILLRYIQTDPAMTYNQMANRLGKSNATVKRLIQKLKAQGMITRVGSDRSGYWEVRR